MSFSMKIRPVLIALNCCLFLLFFSFKKKKKKMVGSIHPFGRYTNDMPHYPVEELVWIVWDRYRGRKPPLKDHCCVCKYVTEWAMDLLWEKWEHGSFIPFGVLVNNLINTDMYDFHMGKVSTGQMPVLKFFCRGVSPDPREEQYIDNKLILRIRNFNI